MVNQYPIADIHEWIQKRQLIGDPPFESHQDPPASTCNALLSTIIDNALIPPIYIGMSSDVGKMKTIRTVYRGGLLIRVIDDFVHNRTFIGRPFGTLSFNTLPRDIQLAFLAYQVPVFEIFGTTKPDILKLIEKVDLLSTDQD